MIYHLCHFFYGKVVKTAKTSGALHCRKLSIVRHCKIYLQPILNYLRKTDLILAALEMDFSPKEFKNQNRCGWLISFAQRYIFLEIYK